MNRLFGAVAAGCLFVSSSVAAQDMSAPRGKAVEACKTELGKSARGTTLSECVTRKMDVHRTANNVKKTGKACPGSSMGYTC